jgi:hypothetical protein
MSKIGSLLLPAFLLASLGVPLLPSVQAASFQVVQDFSGSTFFDKWDFFGNYDNLTGGESFALQDATSMALTV